MAKVSVIIPMYNTEAYIMQCLQSVINQTFRELEIIVIDDGSTDRSLEICKTVSAVDDRIHIFEQKKEGVSSARNRGLEVATSEYVFFLDSDDAIHPCLIESYVKQGENSNVDLMFCTYRKMDTSEIEKRMSQAPNNIAEIQWEVGRKADAKDWFYSKYELELSCIGGKMIRRSFIGQQRFDEVLFSGEDTVFMHSVICREIRMAYLDEEWYYYRIRSDSITHLNNMDKNWQKYEVSKLIRNQEFQTGCISLALRWEEQLVWGVLSNYLIASNKKDKEDSQNLKKMMTIEMKHYLYKRLSFKIKILFYVLFFGCSYFPPIRLMWRMKQRYFKDF